MNDTTNIELEQIINCLPYNTYDNMIENCKSSKNHILLVPSKAIQISNLQHPYFTSIGLFIVFLIAIFITTSICIYYNNYWAMILIPIYYLLSILLKKIKILFPIFILLIFLHLFIIKLPIIIYALSLSYVSIVICQNIWWSKITSFVIEELQNNKNAFVWLWNCHGVGFVDNAGNKYYKQT